MSKQFIASWSLVLGDCSIVLFYVFCTILFLNRSSYNCETIFLYIEQQRRNQDFCAIDRSNRNKHRTESIAHYRNR